MAVEEHGVLTTQRNELEKKLQSMMIKVERPNPGEKEETVNLSATISKGDEQIVQKFKLKVAPWTHPEVVSKNIAMLTKENILKDNISLDNIISDLNLPKTGSNGAKIVWSSENKEIVSDEGKVTRPSFVKGNITLNLTATITSSNISEKKVFTITVIKKAQTTQEYLDSLWDYMSKEVLNLNADKDHITTDLKLPNTEAGTSIEMKSNDTGHISNEGKVVRPKSTQGNSSVNLTFTIKKGDVSITKQMKCVVLADDKKLE